MNRVCYFNVGFIMHPQKFRNRVGSLIEIYICKKYNLGYNNRQQKMGFYDAYNNDTIFEIKASLNNNHRFIINRNNHKRLRDANGDYIFVVYKLCDKDRGLRVISDIKILCVIFLNSKLLDDAVYNKKVETYTKNSKKEYVRVNLREVREIIDDL